MNTKIRNIVFILTDQQRHDTVAALGNPHMHTPNMDRLTREGIAFTNTFACGATCVPSRAAMYTGMYAHNTGCYGFDQWSHHRSWVHELQDAGWHTAAIGKVHHSPSDHPMAFDDRIYAENFPEMHNWSDDYANYLKAAGLESPCKLITQDGQWMSKFGSDTFPLPEQFHVDQYVGRMTTRWIRDQKLDKPFYLHVGFVGPHDPFDPPERFLKLYDEVDIPLPELEVDGLNKKLPHYKRHMESILNDQSWDKGPSHSVWAADLREANDEDFRRMRRHYYAKISQIDEQIGHILDALEQRDLLDSTLIVLSSDHGENLGDHGLLYKWMMTEQTVRVPMLARLPCKARAGTVDKGLFTQMDIGPTVLDAAQLKVPDRLDGRSQLTRLLDGCSSEIPDTVYCEDNYLLMCRTRYRKLIHYAGQSYFEYYDIENDPMERNNLYEHVDYQNEIQIMRSKLFDWLMVSRYHGSLPNVQKANGQRSIWPANHPEDPYVLHPGMIGKNNLRLP